MIVKEHIEFQRGRDPKQSMDIGLFAKINKITSSDLEFLKIYTDGKGKGHIDLEYFKEIYESSSSLEKYIERVQEVYKLLEPYEYLFGDNFGEDMKKEMKDYVKSYLRNPRYNYAYNCDIMEEGDFDVFFCEIELPSAELLGKKNVRESLDFERGKDPKEVLGLGVKEKIRQGILGLLNSSRNSTTQISTINLLKNREDLWLEISDYGTKDFEDVFYSLLSPEYFKDDIYVKAKPRKFSKSWKNDWKVFIKDEYKDFFKACFDNEGYIKESLNFERGMNPKSSMDIGQEKLDRDFIEETNWELPQDIIQDMFTIIGIIRDYKGYPVLCLKTKSDGDGDGRVYIALSTNYRSDYYDIPEEAVDDVKYFIDHGNARTLFVESLNFERGKDPMDAMEIGRVEERRQKLIDEITEQDPEKWSGSSVLAPYTTIRRPNPRGWDMSALEDASMEDLQYAVKYIRKWEAIDKKVFRGSLFDGPASTVHEALGFERGINPRYAMDIGKFKSVYLEGRGKCSVLDVKKYKDFTPEEEDSLGKWYGSSLDRWERQKTMPDYMWVKIKRIETDIAGDIEWMDLERFEELKKKGRWLDPSWEKRHGKWYKIKESINFERGQDPKRSMKIGSIRPINQLKKDYDQIVELIQTGKYLDFQTPFTEEASDLIENNKHFGWGNIHRNFKYMSREELYSFEQLVQKYTKLLGLDEPQE